MACNSVFEEVNSGQSWSPGKMAVHVALRAALSASDDIKDLWRASSFCFQKSFFSKRVCICYRHFLVKYSSAQPEAMLVPKK